MKATFPSRLCLGAALVVLLATSPAFARGRGQKSSPPPAFKPNRPAQRPEPRPNQEGAARPAPNREPHLEQWMENHKTLSPADQRRALQSEPGFHDLPPETQQRELNQLDRLNNMNPQQRSRMLDRTEALERLSPAQRQQWRGAVQQLKSLPIPRQRLVGRAILDLRDMPPQQREQTINSPAFAAQFSPDERSMVHTLLMTEPYPPSPAP